MTKVILDGQQRLTTLFLLIKGSIPPYYTENDLLNDPRNLYFNLQNGEFQYYMKNKMEGNPIWVSVIDCFNGEKVDAFDTADQYINKNSQYEFKEISKIINNNLNKIRAIKDMDYPILTVSNDAEINEAIDVFDRVNSRGTKLTDAELVLTHITGKWAQGRRVMKEKINEMKKHNFTFTLDFLTRCMVVSLTGSALFSKNAKLDFARFTKEDYIENWQKISKAINFLIPILKQDALIDGTNDMNTINVLVPIIAYLLNNDNKISIDMKYGLIYWMFIALIWERYSGQTEQRLDKDVSIIINSENIIEDLISEIQDQRGRTVVKAVDLEGRGSANSLYKMLFIVTKHKKAIDWANGGPIHNTIGDAFSIQSHHIFPKAYLYRNGYQSENHLHKKIVNEIANRAFITRDTNFQINDNEPSIYLKGIETKYPGALEKQFIPLNEDLWTVNKYEEFLANRREKIATEINAFLSDYFYKYNNSQDVKVIDYKKILQKGETNFVEFKSSIRWDYKNEELNKGAEFVIAKTVAAFLNAEGGTLFIGVNDEGEIIGLQKDFESLGGKKSSDEFQQKLVSILNSYIGKEFYQFIDIKMQEIDNQTICVVKINKSHKPVYVQSGKSEEFYIKIATSSQKLALSEANEYIKSHWA